MAESPPNLHHGEPRKPPSDIFFPVEVTSTNFSPHHHYPYSDFASMDDLAQRFAVLALLERRHRQTAARNFELLRPPVRYGSIGAFPAGHVTFNGVFDPGYGVEALHSGNMPVYPYQFVKPVQPQVENFMGTRARILEREHNRLMHNSVPDNRAWPLRGSGGGLAGGGFMRDYGGTGVFLPRIGGTNTTASGATATRRITSNDVRRRPSGRTRQEVQAATPRYTIGRVGVGKQEDCHYHLPPEMDLPQDWTY